MAKIIFTSRYTRAGQSSAGRKNYINYIGTRENVGKINVYESIGATNKQFEFIQQLLNDYKDGKELLEYEDYKNNPSVKNASELIEALLERVTEVSDDREAYIKYIAKRPRVEKIATHGLFSNDGVVENLGTKAKEISEHKGIVWSHVLSLRRENAEMLGYDNYKAFKDLVDENIVHIAKAHKIKIENLKYVSAFHDQSHHPHMHLVIYSSDVKEGYLTEQGIEAMRSRFANSIFKDEMYYSFTEQNKLRDEIRSLSKEQINEYLQNIKNNDNVSEKSLLLIKELHKRLKNHKGSKTYKWFSKTGNEDIKNLIDELTKEISKEENVSKLYDDWYSAKENNLKIYKNTMPKRVALYENENFTTIQNYIIKEVFDLDFTESKDDEFVDSIYIDNMADGYIESNNEYEANQNAYEEMLNNELYQDNFNNKIFDDGNIYSSQNENLYVLWSDKYKEAKELLYLENEDNSNIKKSYELLKAEASRGNLLAIYDVAILNKNEVVSDKEIDIESHFNKALTGFKNMAEKESKMQSYFEYRVGKMYSLGYGAEQSDEEAFNWFEESASKGNQYAQYSLGNCHYYGTGVDVDFDEAFNYYRLATEHKRGNVFASFKLGEMYSAGVGTEVDKAKSKQHYKKAFNGFLNIIEQDIDGSTHLKLAKMYENGLGTNVDLLKAEEFYNKALKYKSEIAKYKLGKLYLSSGFRKIVEPQELKSKADLGIKYLEETVQEENQYLQYASFALANTFLYGVDEIVEVDYIKALDYFKIADKNENAYASFKLGEMHDRGLGAEQSSEESHKYYKKALDGFVKMLDQDTNGNVHLKLGTMYEKGLGVESDLIKAKEFYLKSVDLDNDMARYKLSKLYLSKDYQNFYDGEVLQNDVIYAIEILKTLAEKDMNIKEHIYYALGTAYLFNKIVGRDVELAKEYLTKSAELGNEYAEKLLDDINNRFYSQCYNSILSRAGSLIARSRNQEDAKYEQSQKGRSVDRKLMSKMAVKKKEQGIKY